MDAYRAQQQGYGHHLTIIMSIKVRREEKPHGKIVPQERTEGQILK